jgi:hypothetical protein
VSGDANRRIMKELALSLAINVPENNEKKERPKITIPGDRLFM